LSRKSPARIYVLAGINGAGKSSIGGAMFREQETDYFNPDEAAQLIKNRFHGLDQAEANSMAWSQGRRLLERAISERLDFALETTLGGSTITRLLLEAINSGFEVYVWYVGLASPEMCIKRVQSRVSKGGHDIPEEDIRRRFDSSRLNLIRILPFLEFLRVFDNSHDSDPKQGKEPKPIIVLEMKKGGIVGPGGLSLTPEWAKPIVAAALKLKQ